MKKLIVVLVAIIMGNVCRLSTASAQTNPKEKTIINAFKLKNWLGKWERVSRTDGGTLEIKSISNNSLLFEITVFSGGHTGAIDGKAIINQNTAVYIAKPGPCKLTFHLTGSSFITINQEACDAFGGMGTTFGGKFLNASQLPEKAPATLANLHILTAQQNAAFSKLVDTSYQHFIDCTQLTSTDVKNLDNFNAKVTTSGVRGLFTIMEYIIMIDQANRIWAALINNEKVYYFTNSNNYQHSLPKTIDDWRSRFKEYPVIYMPQK